MAMAKEASADFQEFNRAMKEFKITPYEETDKTLRKAAKYTVEHITDQSIQKMREIAVHYGKD